MEAVSIFGSGNNTKSKKEIVLIMGRNSTILQIQDLMHIINEMDFVNVSGVYCNEGEYGCLANFSIEKNLVELISFLEENNLVLVRIINTVTFEVGEELEEYTPEVWDIVNVSHLGKSLTENCEIIDIIEPVYSSHYLIGTTRTPSGVAIRGKSNYDLTKAGFRIVTIFYYDSEAVNSRSLLPRGFNITNKHLSIKNKMIRSLSIMVSPFDVLELFGDGQMDRYMPPEVQ